MNKIQIEFCRIHNLTKEEFYGDVKVKGSLDLMSLTSIPKGFNPTVGGYLYLGSLTSIPKGFNPTVGGSLDLRSLNSIPKEFNPIVGDTLYLGSLTSIPKGFNPTVGGSLDLRSLTSIPEEFNPIVGGSLDLGSLTSIPEEFNPTVGGYLYLGSSIECRYKYIDENYIFSWNKGKYIKVDGIFAEVLNKKKNVWKVKKIGNNRKSFIVTDGYKYSHGNTIKEANKSLRK